MATDYNATLEQREITLRIALHGIVYIGIIKYEEIVVIRTKIAIYFVFVRLGRHVYQIYVQNFYNARSCFIKFQLRKLLTLQVVSAGFLQCKNDVSASFSCGNFTYAKFPNRFCMLKLFGIAKFQQVSVDGNRLEFGTP